MLKSDTHPFGCILARPILPVVYVITFGFNKQPNSEVDIHRVVRLVFSTDLDDVSDIDLMRLHNTRCMFNGGVGGWL